MANDLMSPSEAASRVLGWTGRFRGRDLLRLIKRKERANGHEIAVRFPGEANGIRYMVTEPMLHLHMPELFAPQINELVREMTKRIDLLKATVGATVDERMAPQIHKIRHEHGRLASEVAKLASATNDGFARFERRLARIERA